MNFIFFVKLRHGSLSDVFDNFVQMIFVDIYDKDHWVNDLYQLMNVMSIHLYDYFVVVDN